MPPKVVITDGLSAQDAERRLGNGAILVFGTRYLQVGTELSKEFGANASVVAAESAAQLPAVDTLMLWAILVFAHEMPGRGGVTESELSTWRDRLFDRLDFVKGEEPMPTVELTAIEGTRQIMLQFLWMGNDKPNWQGVRSGQVKRIALALEQRYLNAAAPTKLSVSLPGPGRDWQRFTHPDGLFSIAHPKRWAEGPKVSDGAALSCATKDGAVLLEVVVMHSDKQRPAGEMDMGDVIADGVAAQINGFRNARILSRKEVTRGQLGRCLRIAAQHDENGMNITSEYYIAASGRDALFVALKCLTSRMGESSPDFAKACVSLQTPWLAFTGHLPPQGEVANQAAAPMPKSSSALIWIAAAVVLALVAFAAVKSGAFQ